MTTHPKDSHPWAYSQPRDAGHPFIELASFRPNSLPNEQGAQQIANELKTLGIESHVQLHDTHGGYLVRIEGLANVSAFERGMSTHEWAKGVVNDAYDRAQKQPVADGIALLARLGKGSEPENSEAIRAALDTLHISHEEVKTGRLGRYYPISDAAAISQIQEIERHMPQAIGRF